MHYAMGLGVAALGLLSAVDSGESAPPAIGAPAVPTSVEHAVEEDLDIVVQEGKTIWFNMAWADFLGTDGEWEEEEIDEGQVRLTPVGEECSLGVRLLWKRQVVYFPMDENCELAFDGDWIKIDQNGRGIVLVPKSGDTSTAPSAASDCLAEMDVSQVANMEWDGDCWETSANPAPGCSMDKSCSGSSQDHCALRLVHITGTSIEGHDFDEECGSSLSVTQCEVGGGRDLLCVSQ